MSRCARVTLAVRLLSVALLTACSDYAPTDPSREKPASTAAAVGPSATSDRANALQRDLIAAKLREASSSSRSVSALRLPNGLDQFGGNRPQAERGVSATSATAPRDSRTVVPTRPLADSGRIRFIKALDAATRSRVAAANARDRLVLHMIVVSRAKKGLPFLIRYD